MKQVVLELQVRHEVGQMVHEPLEFRYVPERQLRQLLMLVGLHDPQPERHIVQESDLILVKPELHIPVSQVLGPKLSHC